MTSRSWGTAGKWTVGGIVYFAFSIWITSLFVHNMEAIAHAAGVSRGTELEILFLRSRIFDLCVFWGALYAGALSKTESFGRPARIWASFACSYVLGLLASAALIWAFMFPLPDWRSEHALYGLLSLKFGLAAVCSFVAIGAWVRIAFGRGKATADSSAVPQNDNC